MVNMSNISFSYGNKKVLEDFKLKVESGERICLFGESGSGKTTILRIILGLEKADSGQVIVGGTPSVVFQENRLLPFKTLMGNIEAINGDLESADRLFDEIGLSEYKNKYPRSLSGGMKRRAAIVRALSYEFDILILDECFSGLDEENIRLCAKIINENTQGKTVIAVTHSKYEAELLNAKIVNI